VLHPTVTSTRETTAAAVLLMSSTCPSEVSMSAVAPSTQASRWAHLPSPNSQLSVPVPVPTGQHPTTNPTPNTLPPTTPCRQPAAANYRSHVPEPPLLHQPRGASSMSVGNVAMSPSPADCRVVSHNCAALYRTAPHCTALYCTVLHCAAPHRTRTRTRTCSRAAQHLRQRARRPTRGRRRGRGML
jgi:hypothetical protein